MYAEYTQLQLTFLALHSCKKLKNHVEKSLQGPNYKIGEITKLLTVGTNLKPHRIFNFESQIKI